MKIYDAGGFSMGGAMALHLGYRFHKKIAGVIAIGSFLPNDSAVYQVCPFFQSSVSIHCSLYVPLLKTNTNTK